jgi:hypothetical protein
MVPVPEQVVFISVISHFIDRTTSAVPQCITMTGHEWHFFVTVYDILKLLKRVLNSRQRS